MSQVTDSVPFDTVDPRPFDKRDEDRKSFNPYRSLKTQITTGNFVRTEGEDTRYTYQRVANIYRVYTKKPDCKFVPVHPEYTDYATRFKSFADFPIRCPKTPSELARAGFYYHGNFEGLLDCVKCFWCDLGLCLWEEGDEPAVEHRRYSPTCTFARAI